MRRQWIFPLTLVGVAAQKNPPSSTTTFSVEPPPTSWSTGEPYTTFGQVDPTGSVATLTTTIQEFPTAAVFVATGLPTTPQEPDGINPDNVTGVYHGVPGYVYEPLYEVAVKQSTGYTIDLEKVAGNVPTLCWYPISGNYTLLLRILFYVTIAAAVLLRSHLPWIYLGALAASLTYSGTAAIHACLLVWRGPAKGELDVLPLLAILSVSCIIMVPLLNWSSTIRTAGRIDLQRQENDDMPKEMDFDSASRIILIFWSFLVTVGFLCVFIALQDINRERQSARWYPYALMRSGTFSCTPESGILNVTAGQHPAWIIEGTLRFNFFSINTEFLDANNCQSPCVDPDGGRTIFRTPSELVPLSLSDYTNVAAEVGGTARDAKLRRFTIQFAYGWSYLVIYILLQGFWTVCFGRNTPSQTRATLYGFLSRFPKSRPNPDKFSTRRRVIAQGIALLAYLWSVFIVLVAIPLLIVGMGVAERYISFFPQSESANHIGSWGPYAGTALVLFAAAIAKSWETLKAVTFQTLGNMWKKFKQIIRPGKHEKQKLKHDKSKIAVRGLKRAFENTGNFLFGFDFRTHMVGEWKSFIEFCRDPESSYTHSLESKKELFCSCPKDYTCEKHKECIHLIVCADKTQCKNCDACNGKSHRHGCICGKIHVTEMTVAVSEGLVPTVDMAQIPGGKTISHSPLYSAVSQDSRLSQDSIPRRNSSPQQAPVATHAVPAAAPLQAPQTSRPQRPPVSPSPGPAPAPLQARQPSIPQHAPASTQAVHPPAPLHARQISIPRKPPPPPQAMSTPAPQVVPP